MADIFLGLQNLRQGLYMLDDQTKAPFGSARIMKNCQITDRGGVAPRLGTLLLGVYNTSSLANKGFYNFQKSFNSDEILLKTYDTYIEAYSKKYASAGWFRIKSTFTSDQEFGFVSSLVNTDKSDYIIFNNRYEEYQRWAGAIAQLNGALSGGETSIVVDSVLTSEVFDAKTAAVSGATLLTITPASQYFLNNIAAPTITIAVPGVVTANGHGLVNGDAVTFATTGALPTGIVAGTIYYVIAVTTNTFEISATFGGSAITTSGSQSGTHTLNKITGPWAQNQWIGFYVYIKTGANANKIRKISSNNDCQIVFDTLGSDPGLCDFEIRQPIFPATGKIIYNGTIMDYTAIPEYNKLTVASAVAAPNATMVTLIPDTYPSNPRGNRLTNYLNRIIVGNVRSALARDSGGALQGYSSAGSYFVSKINSPIDFSFSAPRVAGEGDIVSTPYGGGDITDVVAQEDTAYIFKKNYIESVAYSQDVNDLADRIPLKQGTGSVGKVIKGSDDVYFLTEDHKFTSLGRIKTKDILPQTENLGYRIKRFLDACDISSLGRGIEYNDKIYIPLKSDSNQTYNNIVLVFNKNTKAFEGVWQLPVFGFSRFNEGLYYAESNGANVYQALVDGQHADVVGTTRYAILAEFATNFFNLSANKTDLQAINGISVEGYIRAGTVITFNIWKDFATDPFLTFTFASTEDGFLDGSESSAFLGSNPLSINPLSANFSDPDSDGRRHFLFQIYFPFQYGNFFSVGHSSGAADDDYEITRYGLLMKEDVSPQNLRIKTL